MRLYQPEAFKAWVQALPREEPSVQQQICGGYEPEQMFHEALRQGFKTLAQQIQQRMSLRDSNRVHQVLRAGMVSGRLQLNDGRKLTPELLSSYMESAGAAERAYLWSLSAWSILQGLKKLP